MGRASRADGYGAVALGPYAKATLSSSVALGDGSVANTAAGINGYVPFGASGADQSNITGTVSTRASVDVGSRQITSVAAGTDLDDAVNVSQLIAAQSKVAAGTNVADVAVTENTDGGSIYTVNAEGATVSAGSTNVSVAASTDATTNLTDYTVDLADVVNVGTTNPVNIDGNTGTIDGLTNTTFNPDSFTTGQAATEDQLSVLATDGLDFTGNDNSAGDVHRDLGETLAITGLAATTGTYSGDNLKTVTNPTTGAIELQLADSPEFTNVNVSGDLDVDGTTTLGDHFTVVDDQVTYNIAPDQITNGTQVVNKDYVDGQATRFYSVNNTDPTTGNYDNQGASAANALAAGTNTLASGENATAVGNSANAQSVSGVAIGDEAIARGFGPGQVAIGQKADTFGEGDIAIGRDAKSQGNNNVALGNGATVFDATDPLSVTLSGVALGDGATVNYNDAVALGSGSVTDESRLSTAAYVPAGVTSVAADTAASEVSVGANGSERRITNVAAGGEDTDAVNVSQLKALDSVVDQGFNITADNSGLADPSITEDNVKLGETVDYTSADGNIVTTFGNNDNEIDFGLANTIDVGATNTISIDGDTGTISGLTNTTFDPNATYTGGQAATQEQLTSVSDVANAGWDVQTNGDTSTNVAPGDTVQFLDGNNIDITRTGKDITVATSPDLTVDSLTINNGGPVINDAGIDMGDNKITNVAPGTDGTDAVNVDQLTKVETDLTTKGLDFAGNEGADVHRDLGQTLAIQGEATSGGTYTGANLKTVTDPATGAINLQMTDSPDFTNVNVTNQLDVAGDTNIGGNTTIQGHTTVKGDTYLGDNFSVVNNEAFYDGPINQGDSIVNKDYVDSKETHYYSVNDDGTQQDNFNNLGAEGVNALAAGTNASAKSDSSVAVGDGATTKVFGSGQVAIGNDATTFGLGDIAIGMDAQANGAGNVVIGDGAKASTVGKRDGVALGHDAEVTYDNGVALGSGSVANGSTLSTAAYQPVDVDGNPIAVAAPTADSEVSVGSAGNERRVTNVAAGAEDTDAVNVSQLKAVNQVASQGWDLTANGEATGENIAPGETADFTQGQNIAITRTGNSIEVATADDVEFTNVNVTEQLDVAGDTNIGGNTTIQGDTTVNGDTYLGDDFSVVNNEAIYNVEPDEITNDYQVVNKKYVTQAGDDLIENNPLTFMGDSGTPFDRKLGEQTNVKGGNTGTLTDGNIGVVADGTDTLNIKLAENVDLGENGSVVMGDTIVNGDSVTTNNVTVNEDLTVAGDTYLGDNFSVVDNEVFYDGPINQGDSIVNKDYVDGKETHYYSVNDDGVIQGNYDNDGASGANALAAGTNALAQGDRSIAMGDGASATTGAREAIVIGTNTSVAGGPNAIAIGSDASIDSSPGGAVAIGLSNTVSASSNATTIGTRNTVQSSGRSVVLGYENTANALLNQGALIGTQNTMDFGPNWVGGSSGENYGFYALGNGNAMSWDGGSMRNNAGSMVLGIGNTLNIPEGDYQTNEGSYILGNSNNVTVANGLVIGNGNIVSGTQSLSIGFGNEVSGEGSGAIGDPTVITGAGSYSVGNDNTIDADEAGTFGNNNILAATATGSRIVGNGNNIDVADAFVMGNGADVTIAEGVALGNGAVATTGAGIQGYNPLTGAADGTDAAIAATESTTGALAVGDAANGVYRQITGVAAGATDTDAVNVSQLKALGSVVDQGFNITADNSGLTDPSITEDNVKLGETVDYTSADGNIVTTFGNNDNEIDFGLANTIDVGATNTISIDGDTGTISGLTNTTFNPDNYTTGQAATEDQLKSVSDVANAGWDVQVNTETADNVKPGESVQFIDGKNIDITRTADQVIEVATEDDVEFNQVTIGDPSDSTTSTVLTNVGGALDVSGDQITGVGSGLDGQVLADITGDDLNNAVNVGDLQDVSTAENGGGFGLADTGGATVKQNLGETIKVTDPDGNIVTTADNDKGELQLGLGNDLTIGEDGDPGTITIVGKDGKDGTIGVNGSDGSDGLNGETITRIVVDDVEVATMEDGLKFGANDGVVHSAKLNTQVDITGAADNDDWSAFDEGQNIMTQVDGNNITVALAKDLTGLNSATFVNSNGNDRFTINEDGVQFVDVNGDRDETAPSIAADGIDGGDNQITSVGSGLTGTTLETAEGDDLTNAANIGDLQSVSNKLIDEGLNFSGDLGDAKVERDLGDTLAITGGQTDAAQLSDDPNIGVVADNDNGALQIKLAKNLTGLEEVIVGENGTPGKDGVDGEPGVGLDGQNGAIGITGKDGAGADITVANGAPGVNGTDGITRIVYEDGEGNDYEVATLEDGLKFGANDGDVHSAKLNTQVDITGAADNDDWSAFDEGQNIMTQVDGNNITVALAKDLTGLNSATFVNSNGNDRFTINEDGVQFVDVNGDRDETAPSIAADGIDGGDNQITSVGSGLVDENGSPVELGAAKDDTLTNAANIGDLQSASNKLINEGLNFSGDLGDAKVERDLGDTLAITGGQTDAAQLSDDPNIGVVADNDNGALQIKLAKNLTGLEEVIVGENGAPGKDGVDGEPGVGLDGQDGVIGITGKDGAGADITVANGAPGVNGTDGITRIVYEDGEGNDYEVATLEDGLKFSGNDNPAEGYVTRKLNEEMQIVGGATDTDTASYSSSNVTTVATQDGGIEIQFADTPNFQGADMGDKQITSVESGLTGTTLETAEGDDLTNAVNVGDLQNTTTNLIDEGLNFSGDLGDAKVERDLGDTLAITGGQTDAAQLSDDPNIGVVADNDNGALQIKLAKNLTGLEEVIVGENGTPGKDGVDGEPGVGLDGQNGAIGITGKDGAGADITVADGAPGVNGTDGITRIVYEDGEGNDYEVATLEDDLKFGANDGDVHSAKLNTQVDITGAAGNVDWSAFDEGQNIMTQVDGNNITVALAKNLTDLDSITINDGPTLNNNDIDMGGLDDAGSPTNKITNLAPGDISENSTDAINGSQLYDVFNSGNIEVRYVNTNDEGLTESDSFANGQGSTAVGYEATAEGDESLALGYAAMVQHQGGVALGANAQVGDAETANLGGELREAQNANFIELGAGETAQSYDFAGINPVSIVSVGSAGSERTITNVAAGRITADSTDAINGSQLYAAVDFMNDLDSRLTNVEGGELKVLSGMIAMKITLSTTIALPWRAMMALR
ncbi:hypothetical protein HLB35_05505 [Halomonas sp. TBZ9]|uniref:Trimeric autotransporter adhesin n=1 Tax=Vreelandella azerica TaxID=2732867 RepID=A0A7Y3TW55_9GAMM|nr:hypothetical protein [Halomonas azerica]NOG31356.1 hypothetical protein [Halomonas azerica]